MQPTTGLVQGAYPQGRTTATCEYRTLYLPVMGDVDLMKVFTLLTNLTGNCTDDQLEDLIRNYGIGTNYQRWLRPSDGLRVWTVIPQDRVALTSLLALDIMERMQEVSKSLDDREEVGIAAIGDGVLIFTTGGECTNGLDPTYAYTTWDVVFPGAGLIPDAWAEALHKAAGFLTPKSVYEDGTTVIFE